MDVMIKKVLVGHQPRKNMIFVLWIVIHNPTIFMIIVFNLSVTLILIVLALMKVTVVEMQKPRFHIVKERVTEIRNLKIIIVILTTNLV